MAVNEKRGNKLRIVLKVISILLFVIVLLWLFLILSELSRVQQEQKPIICFNEVKDVEDDDEYSITCYGMLYKYREYYLKENNALSAREFTLFFKEFERDLNN